MKSLALTLALFPLFACNASPSSSESGKQLLGSWRQETEFNGPETKRPLDQRPTLEFSEKTYVSGNPATKGQPLSGTWSIKKEDADGLLVSMTMELAGKEMPMDDKRIKIISRDEIEVRNVKNGSGGIYKRAGSAAEATPKVEAATPAKLPATAVATSGGEGVCEAAVRCCQAAVGASSAMCAPLAKSPAATCESSLASFKKAVKASNPSRAADCEAR